MKRVAPWLACFAGIAILCFVVPYLDTAEPRGVRLTREDAQQRADVEARKMGIPLEKAWAVVTWDNSPILEKELKGNRARRIAAVSDPVVGPELGWYHVYYFRKGTDKFPPYGDVLVSGQTGGIVGERRRARNEEPGAHATEQQLRTVADEFVRTHRMAGVVEPRFDSARPVVLSKRTDWTFRYRIATQFPAPQIGFYLNVNFIGDKLSGWTVGEEYVDGRTFTPEESGLGSTFLRFAAIFVMLLVLLIIFLRKYHAGEVGVGTGAFLFGAMIFWSILGDYLVGPAVAIGIGFGPGLDAQSTALAQTGFRFLFYDVPVSVLVFLAWAVGESYARERWGDRLASFDAILRRDPVNATVGMSVLRGLLTAPAVAAAALLLAVIPVAAGVAWPSMSPGTQMVLEYGGPLAALVSAILDSILIPVVVLLFVFSAVSRKRRYVLGLLLVTLLGVIAGSCEPPIDPQLYHFLFGGGGVLAAAAVFLAYDLLAASTALFGGTLLVMFAPQLVLSHGHAFTQSLLVLVVPFAIVAVWAIIALLTRREIVYAYASLAPHVKRIVERERVKAEIDAANRIQAALLPVESPPLVGATVASHYRAATEIGGDYFDFLPQATGEVGIAFGDVSGHGLTSGIVMAMAKSALLVQVDYDASPRAVLTMLNDIVIRTAPKRMLMTFFFGLLDPQSQSLRFSSAGHLDPYVYRAATNRLEALSSWGYPLGVRRREAFREHDVDFEPGDRLILYSDGLIEALDDDGEPFGFERFEKTLLSSAHGSADEMKKALLKAVKQFTRNRPPEDDQTLVVVSFDAPAIARGVRPFSAEIAEVSETVH